MLNQAASDWEKAQRIRRFTDDIENKISDVTDISKKDKLVAWLNWARDKADWLEPLTAKEDKILGKSKHLFDQIFEEKQ